MIAALKTVTSLMLAVLFLGAANGMLGTLLPVRLHQAAQPTVVVAMLSTFYYMGLIGGCLYAHRIIVRVGHIRSFSALAAVHSAAMITYALAQTHWIWMLLRFIGGYCAAGLFMVIESWINERSTDRIRGSILGIYMVTLHLGICGGQLVLGLAPWDSFHLFGIAAILAICSLIPVALTYSVAPEPPEPKRLGLSFLYRHSPLGVAGAFVSGSLVGAFYGLSPVFVLDHGSGGISVQGFIAFGVLGGTLAQFPLGRLSDKTDRRRVLLGILSLLSVVCIGLSVTGTAAWSTHGAVFVFGALIFTLYPLSVALANDRLERRHLVAASGTLLLVSSVGAGAMPPLIGMSMDAFGSWTLFASMAGLAVVAALYTVSRLIIRAPVSEDEKGTFSPLPRTTPTVGELHPDSET